MSAPAPRTLLDVLKQRVPGASTTTLRGMLRGDRVRVNGATERNAKRPIAEEDRVEIATRGERADRRTRILFEDRDLIVIDKSEGLLTVPSAAEPRESAETLLNAYVGARPGEMRVHHVHRLDRDSSGVLVFAKNSYARERLRTLFAEHRVDRVYVAIAHGRLPQPAGTFRSFLAEGDDLRVRSVGDPSKGKEAITHYRTTAAGRRYAMLELRLDTGRRNQIRVQLAEAGHPVVGDTMYGRGREEALGRLALHARSLGFAHPRSGERLVFTADVPRALVELPL